jgi:7-carboxy-7-deazaguanine synthase
MSISESHLATDMSIVRISEIFFSIQGESSFAGWPCVFIRLAGCSLRCTWCDTQYANESGQEQKIVNVLEETLSYSVPLVEVTGGEPLEQKGTLELLQALCEHQKTVLLETSGSLPIAPVATRVHIIMDIKCTDSGMSQHLYGANLDHLAAKDEVKFVLASRRDYEFACQIICEQRLAERCSVLLSTVFNQIDPRTVVQWMLADRLPARFQLQMHKYIWPADQKGV